MVRLDDVGYSVEIPVEIAIKDCQAVFTKITAVKGVAGGTFRVVIKGMLAKTVIYSTISDVEFADMPDDLKNAIAEQVDKLK